MILKPYITKKCGTFIREFINKNNILTTLVRLENGRFFSAPKDEWTTI